MPLANRLFRTRPRARSAAGGAVVLALALALAGCSSGSKHTAAAAAAAAKPKVLAVKTSVLSVGFVDVESAGPPNVQIDTTTGKAILGAAQAYIDRAVFAPLKTGQLGAGYSALFDPGLQASATGADEGALTDLSVGKVTSLTTKATPVRLSALAGSVGQLDYIATDFALSLTATTAGGPLTIYRTIELTYAQTGKTWLVTAYRVQTARKSVAGTTTTTATATGGTTP